MGKNKIPDFSHHIITLQMKSGKFDRVLSTLLNIKLDNHVKLTKSKYRGFLPNATFGTWKNSH